MASYCVKEKKYNHWKYWYIRGWISWEHILSKATSYTSAEVLAKAWHFFEANWSLCTIVKTLQGHVVSWSKIKSADVFCQKLFLYTNLGQILTEFCNATTPLSLRVMCEEPSCSAWGYFLNINSFPTWLGKHLSRSSLRGVRRWEK